MTLKAVLGLALVLAAPAWAQHGGGGGHGGGHSGGSSGGGGGGRSSAGSGGHAASSHTSAPAHISAPVHISTGGTSLASVPRVSSSGTFTGGRIVIVPAPGTSTGRAMLHIPVPRQLNGSASTPTQRAMPPTMPARLAMAPSAAQPVVTRPLTMDPPSRVVRHPAFFGQRFFFRHPSSVIIIGDGFSCPFFEPIAFDPFLANPLCPFCATGRFLVPNGTFISPFVRRPFFFNGFFRGFFHGFGTGAFFETTVAPAPSDQGAQTPSGQAMAPEEFAPSAPGAEQQPAPLITLLVLKNGWMYGLTDYWIEDGRLHYLTTYGGENSVPLEEIDFDRTVELNAERGVEFVLRPRPRSR